MEQRSGPLYIFDTESTITSLDVIIYRSRQLGKGGYASVYEADWQGSTVAVKELEMNVDAEVRG